ncbi:DUF4339 domain-containing protein [Bdellovibrio bacteriovorus]|uniref:DUF4339 domain-containing protein n=1 Tax=Bdellovibrio bacteriovorus TaxID=959 RepID=UPI003A80FF53
MKNDRWYYNKNLKPQGPVGIEEIRQLILKGDIGPHDLISCDSDGSWKSAWEWGFDRSLFPATQGYVQGMDIAADDKEWVLLVASDDGKALVQEGPYSVREVQESLRSQRVSAQNYIWKSGMSGWSRILDRPEFN